MQIQVVAGFDCGPSVTVTIEQDSEGMVTLDHSDDIRSGRLIFDLDDLIAALHGIRDKEMLREERSAKAAHRFRGEIR